MDRSNAVPIIWERGSLSDFTNSNPADIACLTNHLIAAIDSYVREVPTYKEDLYRAESEVSRYLFDLANYCDEKGEEDER